MIPKHKKTIQHTDVFLGPENDDPELNISPNMLPFGLPFWVMFEMFSDVWPQRKPREPQIHPKIPKKQQHGATRCPNKAKFASNLH